ncbi:hypothetical protein [Geomonas paludis]|uniref:Uncharacterized protein n=1 Tax=Geomonas paludis TaxID=2740185 RepID=A0A6V8MUQ9_9BACT|nr:hypothetical protein [Geomonas paludis]GFO63830.1 hypothetical protein GMPD_17490 [Geomonas paludis]
MFVILYCATWLALIAIVLRKPWMVLRPTVWVALLMTVHLSGAAAFVSDEYNYFGAPRLYEFAALPGLRVATLLFPLCVLCFALLTPLLTVRARRIYQRCRAVSVDRCEPWRQREQKLTLWLAGAALLIVALYLAKVPLQTTGLWANLFDPLNSEEARENSLTLVESPVVRYGYSWYMSTIAPACAGLLWFSRRLTRGRLETLLVLALLALIVVSVMLTGARSPGGSLIMKLGIGYLLLYGVRRGGQVVAVAASGALVVASLLTIARDNMMNSLSLALLWFYLQHGIFERIFISPFSTGVYTNLYAQHSGLLEYANIRPLASLFGVEHLNLAQAVGMRYVAGATENIGMNTCFLFDYQASFGLVPGFIVAFCSLVLLDLLILSFARLRGAALVAFYAVFLGSLMALSSTAFFVSLNTSGVLIVALAAWLVGATYYRRTRPCAA